jgi:CheY-like chemotaxis protein/HPt (histidine-containing phosphotransfer) domain-containing protein
VVLRFEVSDTGIGIPEECREAIFDAFSQVDGSRDRRFGGSGLGLAISRQLARLMGGDLRVQSELGRGSRFVFEAPFARGGLAPCVDESRLASGVPPRHAAIVIAGDPLETEAFEKAARRAGMSVLQTASLIDTNEINVILNNYDNILLIFKSDVFAKSSSSFLSVVSKSSLEGFARLLIVRNGIEEGVVKNMPIPDHVVTVPLTSLDIQHAMNANDDDPKRWRMAALPALSGKRVLLVEDSPANAKLAMAMLKVHGVVVDWRDNGQAGLDALTVTPDGYDAALIDIQMPGMDGYEVVRRMRRAPMFARLPAIAVTANAFPEDRERAFEAGFDMFLAKPFTSSELGRSLQELLALASTRRSSDLDGQFLDADGKGSGPFTADGGRILPAAFDSARALERMDGSEDLLRSFVKDALPHFEASVAQARQAVSGCRIDDAARELHTLKGLAATLFADRIVEKAEAMRVALRAGSYPDEQDWIGLETECSNLIDGLHAYLRKPVTYSRSLDECLADFKACLDSGSLRAVDCAIEAERLDPALTGLSGLVRSGSIVRARALLESFARKRVDV